MSEKTKMIAVKVPPELLQLLKGQAGKDNRTINGQVLHYIKTALGVV